MCPRDAVHAEPGRQRHAIDASRRFMDYFFEKLEYDQLEVFCRVCPIASFPTSSRGLQLAGTGLQGWTLLGQLLGLARKWPSCNNTGAGRLLSS
jgi:hypothetical protein